MEQTEETDADSVAVGGGDDDEVCAVPMRTLLKGWMHDAPVVESPPSCRVSHRKAPVRPSSAPQQRVLHQLALSDSCSSAADTRPRTPETPRAPASNVDASEDARETPLPTGSLMQSPVPSCQPPAETQSETCRGARPGARISKHSQRVHSAEFVPKSAPVPTDGNGTPSGLWRKRLITARDMISRVAKTDGPSDRSGQQRPVTLQMVARSISEHKTIVQAMRQVRCFAATSDIHLSMLAAVARPRTHSRYSVIYREGATATSFYLLLRGSLTLSAHNGVGGRPLKPQLLVASPSTSAKGDGNAATPICFGTEGVAGGMHRIATATCAEESVVLHLSIGTSGMMDGESIELLAKRTFAYFVEAELSRMTMFHGLGRGTMHEIACMFELSEVGMASETLFRPGEHAQKLYILAKGRVLLEAYDGTVLAKLTAGSVDDGYPFFGQTALIRPYAHDHWAVTRTPVKLLVLPRSHFQRLFELVPGLQRRLLEFHGLRLERAALIRQAREAQHGGHGTVGRRDACDSEADDGKSLSTSQDEVQAANTISKHLRGMQVRNVHQGESV